MKVIQRILFVIAIILSVIAIFSYGYIEHYFLGILFLVSACCFFASAIINTYVKKQKK